VAVIAELEAAAGEPANANPGLGLVASVIVYGCLGQDAGVDPGADRGVLMGMNKAHNMGLSRG
jgi:hypothetical protein